VLGLLLRVPALGSIPYTLNPDEGLIGLLSLLPPGIAQYNVFGGQFAYSSMYYLAVGAVAAPLGNGIAALRMLNAIGGSLAIPTTYLAGRQLLGRRVGIVAGALLATLHIHIHFSRTALGQSLDTLIAAVVILALARGLDRRDFRWMVAAGVGLGLAQFGYVGGRLIDLVVLAFALTLPLIDMPLAKRSIALLLSAFGAAMVTAAPMIRFAVDHSDTYLTRLNEIGIVQSGQLHEEVLTSGQPLPLQLLWHFGEALRTIAALPAGAFYFADRPMLDLAWTALVVLGLGYALVNIRNWRFLLLGLHVLGGVSLLAFSSPGSVPVYRTLGMTVSLSILAAFSLVLLAERGLPRLEKPTRRSDVVIAIVVGAIAMYNVVYYFVDYSRSCQYGGFQVAAASIASEYIRDQDRATTVFMLTPPTLYIGAYPSTRYLTGRQERVLFPLPADAPAPGDAGSEGYIYAVPPEDELPYSIADSLGHLRPLLFVALPDRSAELDRVAERLPGGERTTLYRCEEPLFEVYLLN
jgi:asparagine N-glycosylation enzyme membrane subunit Stt3